MLPELLVLVPDGSKILSLHRAGNIVPGLELCEQDFLLLIIRGVDLLKPFLDYLRQAGDPDLLSSYLQ
jgi:hypothetical protein